MIQWIVAGLGNPGRQYQNTRHNVGFMVVERYLIQETSKKIQETKKFDSIVSEINKVLVMKPQTFMNKSGQAISAAVRFYKIPLDHLVVIHDDLDIPLGMVKTGYGKGPKVHNGIDSIESSLGAKDFWRIRVGTDNRTAEDRSRISPTDYVLKQLEVSEISVIETALAEACKRVKEIVGSHGAIVLE